MVRIAGGVVVALLVLLYGNTAADSSEEALFLKGKYGELAALPTTTAEGTEYKLRALLLTGQYDLSLIHI